MDFTKRQKDESKSYGLTVNERAMADLIAMGWKDIDAFLMTNGVNPAYSAAWHKKRVAEITRKEVFKDYMEKIRVVKKKNDEEVEKAMTEEMMTKEEVATELMRTARSLSVKDPKRADVLMKYADLTQMKKAEEQTEDKTIHFYMPLTCKQCMLWSKHKAEMRKKNKMAGGESNPTSGL